MKFMDYEAEYEGYGTISYVKSFYSYILYGFQVVRSRNYAIRALFTFSLGSPYTKNTVFLQSIRGPVTPEQKQRTNLILSFYRKQG